MGNKLVQEIDSKDDQDWPLAPSRPYGEESDGSR